MRKKAFAFALAALLLCSCGSKKQDFPEDTPYNRGLFNSGAIMETEDGYYTSHVGDYGSILSMRFYERDTDKQIYLCAKPECIHDGSDSCTATYKNLECVSSLIYDGAIYDLTIERGDTSAMSIYKATLDGTSLTKICDVFTVETPSENEELDYKCGGFMIHKGQAYVSYHFTLGDNNYTGFIESGLAKIDITNGKKEILWNGKDAFTEIPSEVCGSGDYVYYSVFGADRKENGFYRYDIKTGEIEKIMQESIVVVGERKFFTKYQDESDGCAVFSCGKEKADIEKAEADGYELVAEGFEYIEQLFSYKDMVIVIQDGKVTVCSEDGGVLGEISYTDTDWYNEQVHIYDFTISDGKVYVIFDPNVYEDGAVIDINSYTEVVYSYPLEDIINGKGEWKFEYGVKSIERVNSEEMGNIYRHEPNS